MEEEGKTPWDALYYNLGLAYFYDQQYGKAIEALEQAHSLNPLDIPVYNRLILAGIDAGNDLVVQKYRKYRALATDYIKAVESKGIEFFMEERDVESLGFLSRLIQHDQKLLPSAGPEENQTLIGLLMNLTQAVQAQRRPDNSAGELLRAVLEKLAFTPEKYEQLTQGSEKLSLVEALCCGAIASLERCSHQQGAVFSAQQVDHTPERRRLLSGDAPSEAAGRTTEMQEGNQGLEKLSRVFSAHFGGGEVRHRSSGASASQGPFVAPQSPP